MISWDLSICLQPPEELFFFKEVSWRIRDLRPKMFCSNAGPLMKDWILSHGVLGMTMSTKVVVWLTSLRASYRQRRLLLAPRACTMDSIPRFLHVECCPLSAISVCLSGLSPLSRGSWNSMKPSLISPSLNGPSSHPNYHNSLCPLSYFLLSIIVICEHISFAKLWAPWGQGPYLSYLFSSCL